MKKNKYFASSTSGNYNLSNSNTIPHLRICILSLFTETPALVFVFHSTLDVGRSTCPQRSRLRGGRVFDVHLLICSMFIFFSKYWVSEIQKFKVYGVFVGNEPEYEIIG